MAGVNHLSICASLVGKRVTLTPAFCWLAAERARNPRLGLSHLVYMHRMLSCAAILMMS